MSDLVGKPNCWFSHVKAQMVKTGFTHDCVSFVCSFSNQLWKVDLLVNWHTEMARFTSATSGQIHIGYEMM